jgi:hypothetical protein
MVERTAGPCYFVAAVTDEDSGIPLTTHSIYNGDKGGWDHDVDVADEMAHAQSSIFEGKMAYAVVTRTGMITRIGSLQGLLDFFWYAAYMTSRFAAEYHRFAPSASSLVIRTRFDLFYDAHFDMTPIISYFENGERGEHLGFAQEADKAQSDYFLMMSYGAYARNLAGAYERGMYKLARSNGWGIGFSLCGFHESCSTQNKIEGPSLDLSSACRAKQLPYSDECCPENMPCMMTFVRKHVWGASFIQRTNFTLRVDPSVIRSSALDLTKQLVVYCPVDIHGMSCGGGGTMLTGYFCSRNVVDLTEDMTSPWPPGC